MRFLDIDFSSSKHEQIIDDDDIDILINENVEKHNLLTRFCCSWFCRLTGI
jgi:hypothetical protein